jgi:hexosaminidase
MRRRAVLVAIVAVVVVAGAATIWAVNLGGNGPDPVRRSVVFADVLPAPMSLTPAAGVAFAIADGTPIVAQDAAAPVGDYLAAMLGHGLTVRPGREPTNGAIALLLDPAGSDNDEGYQLDVAQDGVTIRARKPAGLFWGVQTLRQLLPGDPSGAVSVPAGRIVDRPRFVPGVMLDVARHFFDVAAAIH